MPKPAHPPDAERLDFNDFVRHTAAPSRFAPKAQVKTDYFVCPACEAQLPRPGVLERADCSCGLRMHRGFGGDLFVWRDEPEARCTYHEAQLTRIEGES